ncbi:MAG: AbrB family transcriptional regulator [Bacillota bacterium]
MEGLLLLFSAGILGWFLFLLLNVSSAAMLGPIAAVAVLNLAGFSLPEAPEFLSPMLQVALGLYLGGKVRQEEIEGIKSLLRPALLMLWWALFITFGLGYLLTRMTSMSFLTAVLGTSPGGAAEVGIIAVATGADVATVTILQVVRLFATLIFFPLLLQQRGKKMKLRGYNPLQTNSYLRKNWEETKSMEFGRLLVTLSVTTAGAYLFYKINFPAGWMFGAMASVIILTFKGYPIQLPPKFLLNLSLVGLGLILGQSFSGDLLGNLGALYPAIIINTLILFLAALLLAKYYQRTTNWDYSTCICSTAPGGVSAMVAVAEAYGADSFKVSLLHLVRVLAIKASLPLIVLIAQLFDH